MIRLIGTIDAVFGSFICFRGFAPFSVLSTISKPDENYQRSQNDSHVIELRNFLIQNISQRFFPEIILGSSWPDCGINESNEIDTLLHNTTQTQQKTYRGNGITVVINKPQYKSATTRLCTFNLKNSLHYWETEYSILYCDVFGHNTISEKWSFVFSQYKLSCYSYT